MAPTLAGACVLAVLSSAVAFVPFQGAKLVSRSVCASAKKLSLSAVNDMLGSGPETGGVWDPLGYSKDEASLFRNRAVELKHGRVAMLAVVGNLVQSFVHLPDPVFSNPRPLGELADLLAKRPLAFWQIFLAIGALELSIGKQDEETKAPGDLGYGDWAKPTDEAEWEKLQVRELKNGRLLAFMGEITQEYLTGQGPIEQIAAGHISPFGDGQGFF